MNIQGEQLKTTTMPFPSLTPFLLWSTFAWKSGEMMIAAAQVIGRRSEIIAATGMTPDADARRELDLMGPEKISAAIESGQAMAWASIKFSQQLAAMAFQQMSAGVNASTYLAGSRNAAQAVIRQATVARNSNVRSIAATSRLSNSAARIGLQSLAPVHSKATRNAKRLKKR